ncbi:hypothetical protein BT96DRAFT_928474, partial [Gymnopus androsaceus JB14]
MSEELVTNHRKHSLNVNSHDTGMFANASNFEISGGQFMVTASGEERNLTSTSDEEKKISEWLNAPDCLTNFTTAINKKTAGTGQWILSHPEYVMWRNSPNILWIKGKAGSGKTILSTTIIEDLRHHGKDNVCFHYFDSRDNSGAKSGYRGLLLSLIQQMSYHKQTIHSALQRLYESCRHGLSVAPPSNTELEICLNMILEEATPFIVLDAMDECCETVEVLNWLSSISNKLWIVVTSCHPPEGQLASVTGQITIDNPDSGIHEDIATYLQIQMQNHIFKGDLKTQVTTKLIEKSQGQFRWVDCQFKVLKRCATPKVVWRTLEKLPHDLEETYAQAVKKSMESEHNEDAHNLLLWLTYAFEPLSLNQVADILSIDLDEQVVDQRDLMDFKLHLVIDSNLVAIDTNNVVQLAHYSVKEFLIKSSKYTQTLGLFEINEQLAHHNISQACIIYILQLKNDFLMDDQSWPSFPLVHYASKYWIDHMKALNVLSSNDALYNLAMKILNEESPQFITWSEIYEFYEKWKDINYNSEEILHKVASTIQKEHYIGGKPLYYAAICSHKNLVEFLVSNNQNLDAQGGTYGSCQRLVPHNTRYQASRLPT